MAHCAQPLLPSHRQDALSKWPIVAECCNLGTTNLSAAGPLRRCSVRAGRVSTERGTRNGNARETQNSAFRIAFRERIPGTPTRNPHPGEHNGVVGCPLKGREKARPLFVGHYRVPISIPGALIKRRGQDPPLSPCTVEPLIECTKGTKGTLSN